MVTASGEVSHFVGKIQTSITLGKNTFKHEMLITEIKNDGILGMYFLEAMNCNVNLDKNIFRIGETVKCYVQGKVDKVFVLQ